jgi:hypothetical protein
LLMLLQQAILERSNARFQEVDLIESKQFLDDKHQNPLTTLHSMLTSLFSQLK